MTFIDIPYINMKIEYELFNFVLNIGEKENSCELRNFLIVNLIEKKIN